MYEKLETRLSHLNKEIVRIQKLIESLPNGKITLCNTATNYKCFYTLNGERSYIPKKNNKLISDLSLKKYYSCQINDYKNEIKAISNFLRFKEEHSFDSAKHLLYSHGYNTILKQTIYSFDTQVEDWLKESVSLAPFQENRIFKTISGEMVRSKSEVMILDRLFVNKIPYRYEYPLIIGDTTYYPDITIPVFSKSKFIYWEHFGLMNDTEYVKHMSQKISVYSSAGIIPNVDLIMTFESESKPLDTDIIDSIIEYYFKNN